MSVRINIVWWPTTILRHNNYNTTNLVNHLEHDHKEQYTEYDQAKVVKYDEAKANVYR